jgi:hypothetical protein
LWEGEELFTINCTRVILSVKVLAVVLLDSMERAHLVQLHESFAESVYFVLVDWRRSVLELLHSFV